MPQNYKEKLKGQRKREENFRFASPDITFKKGRYENLYRQVSTPIQHHPDAISVTSPVQGDIPNILNIDQITCVAYTLAANFQFLAACLMRL